MRGLVVFDRSVLDLTSPQQVVGVEQAPGDFRPFLHRPADRRRNALPGLATQPRVGIEMHVDAAHAAHLAMGRLYMQANAQLLEHALLHALEVFQAVQVFQALEQALLLAAGQQQDARVGTRSVQQLVALTVAGTRWAGSTQGQW